MSDEYTRALAPAQRCEVWTYRLADGQRTLRLSCDNLLLEAPNWTLDGESLILNGDGKLWRLGLADGDPSVIPLEGVPALNNDHVLDPDGAHVYVSANDWHIYRAPLGGGRAVRVTDGINGLLHFLHGVEPSGRQLAFIGLRPDGDDWWAQADVYTMSTSGGEARRLTVGPGAADGSEFSPDGAWIYFNTETFDGHAQIARMRPDGSGLEQLTADDRVNWFPHPSPDGGRTVYLSFPPGTKGHPANVHVELRLVEQDGWAEPRTLVELFGGQGTINVPSWSPTGEEFAYVAYPMPDESATMT